MSDFWVETLKVGAGFAGLILGSIAVLVTVLVLVGSMTVGMAVLSFSLTTVLFLVTGTIATIANAILD